VIERACADDLPAVRHLLESEGLPLDEVEAQVSTMVVARDGGEVVGAAALELYKDGALLRSVVVAAGRQGAGLGHRLTEAALTMAGEHGARTVFLLTTTAAAFFPRFGFQAIPRDRVPASVLTSVEFQSACPSSAVVMRKELVT
jgi:amino-acid N-acetyltransferase